MLNLVKMCAGVASPADLRDALGDGTGRRFVVAHETRSTPKRASEIAGKGSLYWVMKGRICCRQAILRFEPVTVGTGAPRCRIVMSPEVVDVEQRPRKMFQGWRYLEAADAPPDLSEDAAAGLAAMPEAMRRELALLGLV